MRVSRIFVDHKLGEGAQFALEADTCHYLRNVLRLKSGASITLFNGRDLYDYSALLSYEGKQAIVTIQNRDTRQTESNLSTEIIQGLSRSDHMDWMIQKCTELGVTRISVFNARYSQILLKSAQQKKRLQHWHNIAIKACEQCGRQIPPRVSFEQNLASVLDDGISRQLKILLNLDGERLPMKSIKDNTVDQVTILLGPEGGLSESEINAAQGAGFISSRLGPRVLRTETAAATALAILQYQHGDI